jgi:glycosyltransferase involved in cell wall biosynthesis
MPLAWRALGKAKYDIVITSHHAFAHTHRLALGGAHLVYVHSPARYVWSPDIDERGSSWYLGPPRAALRKVDLSAVRRVTAYAANSSEVARRIREHWNREAVVIHPPVRVEFFGERQESPPSRDYVLGVGRWIPYKNLHLVIDAADRAGLPVKVAGRGPDKSRILAAAAAAKVPVDVIESPSNEDLRDLYRNAACFVFPTVEDFGIVPVEAQAAGTPVVALRAGGALDTVIEGRTGAFAQAATPKLLAQAIQEAIDLSPEECRRNAVRFSTSCFQDNMRAWVAAVRT